MTDYLVIVAINNNCKKQYICKPILKVFKNIPSINFLWRTNEDCHKEIKDRVHILRTSKEYKNVYVARLKFDITETPDNTHEENFNTIYSYESFCDFCKKIGETQHRLELEISKNKKKIQEGKDINVYSTYNKWALKYLKENYYKNK